MTTTSKDDVFEAVRKALADTRTTLNQSLGIIVEFGNLNGFKNLSDAELGKALIFMAESASAQIAKADAALALANRVMKDKP
jgi:hypothetical protein